MACYPDAGCPGWATAAELTGAELQDIWGMPRSPSRKRPTLWISSGILKRQTCPHSFYFPGPKHKAPAGCRPKLVTPERLEGYLLLHGKKRALYISEDCQLMHENPQASGPNSPGVPYVGLSLGTVGMKGLLATTETNRTV